MSQEERAVDHGALAAEALAKAPKLLQPDAGEVHRREAWHASSIDHDFPRARREIDLARRSLPNNAEVEKVAGHIALLQGRWDDAVAACERAVALEPRNPGFHSDLSTVHGYLRRYADFDRELRAMISLTPADEWAELPLIRAMAVVEARADLAPLRAALAELPARP